MKTVRMKKVILLLSILTTGLLVPAQICSPDTNYSDPGIYPKDSILPEAEVNMPYEVLITVIVPKDTNATVFNQKQVVLIDSIQLYKTIGFPDWLSIVCDSTCGYPGGDTGCAILTGTPPDSIADTTYSLGFITKTFARLQALPSFTIEQNDTLEAYWSLTMNNPFISGLNEKPVENFIGDAYIIENQLYLSGFSKENSLIQLKLTNIAGQVVYRRSWSEMAGKFNRTFTSPALPAGIYILSLEDNNQTEVKKMLIH